MCTYAHAFSLYVYHMHVVLMGPKIVSDLLEQVVMRCLAVAGNYTPNKSTFLKLLLVGHFVTKKGKVSNIRG